MISEKMSDFCRGWKVLMSGEDVFFADLVEREGMPFAKEYLRLTRLSQSTDGIFDLR